MSAVTLVGLPYSPWTEKARWALDRRGVPYTFQYYQPLLGEPGLRIKLRRLRGRVSVPVLVPATGAAIDDSTRIARWANTQGQGDDLFPAAHAQEVDRWADLSERALAAGRALSLRRMVMDEEALGEMVPPVLRKFGGPARTIAGVGVARTLRKYQGHEKSAEEHESEFAGFLDTLRQAVRSLAPGAPMLGTFSFADIAAAQMLAFVSPPTKGLRIGNASRRTFSSPGLAARYQDLLAWRDAVYERHRGL
jgi:glutathione S-transferase